MKRRGFLGLLGSGIALPLVPTKLSAEQLPKEIVVPKEDPTEIVAFTKSLHATVCVNGDGTNRNLNDCLVQFAPCLRSDTIEIQVRIKPRPTDSLNPLRLNIGVWRNNKYVTVYQSEHRNLHYDPLVEFYFTISDSFHRLRGLAGDV